MTWVAAQTERIHIAANVLERADAPPAVTARAAASLDLLSGGRFDLALGAGAFWDAMEAMGARRLTPGEAVDALSEAIDIIRGDLGRRRAGAVAGRRRVLSVGRRQARPGAGARHPDLAGRLQAADAPADRAKADGWLPSLGYMQAGRSSRPGTAIIDEAAAEAGRDPREIRRLLNISGQFRIPRRVPRRPARAVGRGAAAAGVRGRRRHVHPGHRRSPTLRAVRRGGGAGAARGGAPSVRRPGCSTASVRSSAVRAGRREGIDYDHLPASLATPPSNRVTRVPGGPVDLHARRRTRPGFAGAQHRRGGRRARVRPHPAGRRWRSAAAGTASAVGPRTTAASSSTCPG